MQNMLKTKMRTITRYLAAAAMLVFLACLANFILAPSGTADTGQPMGSRSNGNAVQLVEKIIEHRDFFIRFDGHDEDLLCDVNDDLGENRIGLLLLESTGFLKSLVYDRSTLGKIHEDASIPPKSLRVDLSHSAVSVSDARLIAKNIVGLRTENAEKSPRQRRKTALRETQRREAMPQSLPAGFAPVGARRSADTGTALERLRRDVENNSDLAAMTSEEILERFRSDVRKKKEVQPIP
ncbi:MAG: hypothetical protein LBP21_05970 [Synergistaceae bacterium]|jgi:hypothetical protein|nr:hypothetical protein [Synergistaceae bacterium]